MVVGILAAWVLPACAGNQPEPLARELAEVCDDANADLDAIPAPTATGDPDGLAAFFRATAAANRSAATRVAGLETPDELLEDRDGLVDAINDVASALDAAATAVVNDDEEALGTARDQLLDARERFDDLAAKLGAGPCLRSRSPSPSN
jgi:hypothetical protein